MNPLQRIKTWFADRIGIDTLTKPLYHPVPPETTEGKSAWAYVFGFGILFAFLVQVITGVVLATKYVPSPDTAYQSIQFITDEVAFGRVIRGMHWFGASAMVILVIIHALRVFLTGSYKYPREFNWISGVVLLYLTFGMAFTGQLLRWDQNGIWTVLVGANFAGRVPIIGEYLGQLILAGETMSGATLSRFFVLHVFVLPAMIVLLIGLHMFLVLRHGISEFPKAGQPVDPRTYREQYRAYVERHNRLYWPDAMWKEVLFGGLVIVTIIALAVIFGPRELAPPPSLIDLRAAPQPDWFLIWYYALISIQPHGWENFFLVYLPLLFMIFLIILPILSNRGERSPRRRPFAVFGASALIGTLVLLIVLGHRAPWVPDYETEPLTAAELGVTEGPVLEGARIFYERDCQYCHVVLDRGGGYGPELTNVTKRLPPEEITIRIVQGIGNMPPYQGTLTEEELDRIMVFLVAISEMDRE